VEGQVVAKVQEQVVEPAVEEAEAEWVGKD
jgi:hypothetical protein